MEHRIQSQGDRLAFFGRTLYDDSQQAMFFNWTGSGFAFAFCGSSVSMQTVAFSGQYPGEGENLPWIAVFVDDQQEPLQILKVQEGEHRYTLFESETAETHTVRVVKRSENSKGRIGIKAITVDGELMPYQAPQPKIKLEFVGDSITCGFGNDMTADERVFDAAKENGLTAYPAVAAELLGASYHSIGVSGIPLCWAADPHYKLLLPEYPDFSPPIRTMEDYYRYTDRNHQEAMGMQDAFEPWDFKRFQPDAIIVNLGTNDGFRLRVSGCKPEDEAHFGKRYQAFLTQLRQWNGPGPVIACTLGSMDYYLYDVIVNAVAEYQRQTGDARVFCMKFAPIDPWGEGYGGLGHPNTKTQIRMGQELAEALRPWLVREDAR